MVDQQTRGRATVTSEGQITIPRAVRERLDIRPGDEVEFLEDESGIRVVRQVPEDVFGPWMGQADLKGVSTDEWIEELRGR